MKNTYYKNIISINKNIHSKIFKLDKILIYLNKYELYDKNIIDELNIKLKKLRDIFVLSTMNYMSEFYEYMEKTNNKQCSQISDKFIFYINSNNIENKLNDIKNKILLIISKFEKDKLEHYTLIEIQLNKFDNINIKIFSLKNEKISCDNCKNDLQIPNDSNEVICDKCGLFIKLYNVYHNNLNNSINFNKINSYIPTKHCREWINRIQAKEKIRIPNTVINKIKKYLKENNINYRRYISYYDMRTILSILNLSKYNENIPLIKKIITGKKPCQLTQIEEEKICYYFRKVSNIYLKIKPSSKTNVPYHPYLILKIIEQIMNSSIRKRQILSNIYLQSRETIIDKDKLWKKICNYINEFKYIPTNKLSYQFTI